MEVGLNKNAIILEGSGCCADIGGLKDIAAKPVMTAAAGRRQTTWSCTGTGYRIVICCRTAGGKGSDDLAFLALER